LALTGLLGSLALTWTRFRHAEAEGSVAGGASAGTPKRASAPRLTDDPGFAARQGQAFIVPLGAVLIWLAVHFLWPGTVAGADPTTANIAAAFVFALAFVSLVAERVMHAFPEPQLPEAPSLRRLLLLTTVILVAAAAIELGRGAALAWLRWLQIVIAILPCVVVASSRAIVPPAAARRERESGY
jgi:hypothetical protein